MLLLAVVFSSLLFQTERQITADINLVSLKTSNLNAFVRNLDEDVERGLFIAAFRALLAADNHISDTNSFLTNSESSLKEAMVNGTIDGLPASMMTQSTLPEWLSRIRTEAIRVGILVNFSDFDIGFNQSSAWAVNFFTNVSYNVTDRSSTATFRRSQFVTTAVNIQGLKDPVHTIFTNGQILRVINETPYEDDYVSGVNTLNLQAHINDLYYAVSSGPSYLMRLEGDLSNSTLGIESIVRLPDLQAQGIPVFERSSVDYIYFSNATPQIFIINNTFEDWFRLDGAHLEKYQVESITE